MSSFSQVSRDVDSYPKRHSLQYTDKGDHHSPRVSGFEGENRQSDLAKFIIENEAEYINAQLNMIRKTDDKKEIDSEFQSKIQELRKFRDAAALHSLDYQHTSDNVSVYLDTIYNQSKHGEGLIEYQSREVKRNQLKSMIQKGLISQTDPRLKDLLLDANYNYSLPFDIPVHKV